MKNRLVDCIHVHKRINMGVKGCEEGPELTGIYNLLDRHINTETHLFNDTSTHYLTSR